MWFTFKPRRRASMGNKRSANPVMVMRVLDVVLMPVYNIVMMKMNAFSSFTLLQRRDAFFTEVAMRPEVPLTLAQQLKLRSARRMLQLQSGQLFHLQEVQQLRVLRSLHQFNLLEVLRSLQQDVLQCLHQQSLLHNRQRLQQVNLLSLHQRSLLEVRQRLHQVDLRSLHQHSLLEVRQRLQQVAQHSLQQVAQHSLQQAALRKLQQVCLRCHHRLQSQQKHPQWLMALM